MEDFNEKELDAMYKGDEDFVPETEQEVGQDATTEETVEAEIPEIEEEKPAEKTDEDDNETEDSGEENEDIESVRILVNELSRSRQKESVEKKAVKEEPDEKVPEKIQKKVSAESFGITEERFEELMGSHQKFTEFLNEFASNIKEIVREEALRDIPSYVMNNMSEQLEIKDEVTKFYTENPDLMEYRDYVGHVCTELQSKHPDYSVRKLFQETEREVRGRLKKVKKTEVPSKVQPPAAPNRSRKDSKVASGIQNEIEKMLNV